jgi:monoamine oxidase
MQKTYSRRQALSAALLAGSAPLWLAGCNRPVGRDADVIIVGAGLSALHAARLLEQQGLSVLVVEASERVGGRIVTLHDVPGAPEGGGSQIGSNYARTLATIEELGLETHGGRGSSFGRVFNLGGEMIRTGDWPNHTANRTEGRERNLPPWQLLAAYVDAENPLSAFDDWMSPELQHLDQSCEAFMAAQGASAQAIELAGVSMNANSLDTVSVFARWRSGVLYRDALRGGRTHFIVGGNQRLPEAMAASLSAPVLLGRKVTGLRADARGGEVRCADGGIFRGDFVLCTLPFAVLRGLVVDAPLTGVHREAIAELPYTQIAHIHFAATQAYWEEDGWAPAMWTDSPLQRVFMSDEVDGTPNGQHMAWLDGQAAIALAGRSDSEVAALVLREMARMRPASAGHLEVQRVVRWTQENPYAGGAYMHWAPGMIERFAGRMHAPAGRLHFAGEHTGIQHTGIEAAMESGERAALEILQQVGGVQERADAGRPSHAAGRMRHG